MSDRQDDLHAVWDHLEKGGEPAPEEPEGTPEPETEPEAEAIAAEPVEATEPAPKDGRARDESGRFTKQATEPEKPAAKAPTVRPQGKPSTTEAPKPQAPVTTETPRPQAPVTSQSRAPQSWKPAAREKWASLPPEVQAEAVRIDREVRQVMQESAAARKQVEALQQTTAPYEQMLRAQGIDPMQAVAGGIQAAAQFNSPNPDHVAGFLSHMIRVAVSRHGEGFIDKLAGMYDGGKGQPAQQFQAPPQQQAPDIQSLVRQQISDMVNGAQVKKFLDTEPEFLDDVFPTMTKLLETGLAPDVERAYNMAIQMDPELAGIVRQREAAAKVRANPSGSTQKARAAAAVSLKAAHAPGVSKKDANGAGNSRRQDLEEAWQQVAGE